MEKSGVSLAPPRFNVRLAATSALGLLQEITRLGLADRLEQLHRIGEFDLVHLRELPDLANAAWYIRHRLDQATALTSEARIPATLAEDSQKLRARMLKVLDFHFEDDALIAPQLAYIRRGSGYQDLADDLTGLATLYGKHEKQLAGTPRIYQASDQKEALRLAQGILSELGIGGSKSPSEWSLLQQRVSELLATAYDEISAATRYLCRAEPDVDTRFPRLASIARSRPTRSKSPATPSPDPEAG